jgi:GntR family transcriptional regulator
MTLNIEVRPSNPVPIFRQIVEQVCAAVVAGKVKEDEPLPSVRALAEQLVINPNTVARAYGELARDGVIESRQGRGMYVSSRRVVYSGAERSRRLERSVDSLIAEAYVLGYSADELMREVANRARDLDARSATRTRSKTGSTSSPRESR